MGIVAEAFKAIFCPHRALTPAERKRAKIMMGGGSRWVCLSCRGRRHKGDNRK